MTDKEKKQMVQCRSCNKVYNQSNLIKIHSKVYDIDITDRACPECGGICGLVDYPYSEKFLIYKKKNFFYRNDGQHMKPLNEYYDMIEEDNWE